MSYLHRERFIKKARAFKKNAPQAIEIGEVVKGDSLKDKEIVDLKSKNLLLSLNLSDLNEKLKNAKFPEEGELPNHKVIILDSSAVTRAKLKKCFKSDKYDVLLPRNSDEAKSMILSNKFKVAIIEFGSNDSYGLDLIHELSTQMPNNIPLIIVTTFSDNILIPSHLYHLIQGIFQKPWDEEQVKTKIDILLGN